MHFSVLYVIDNQSQAWKKEGSCGRLTTSVKFSHFTMNGSITTVEDR